MKYCEDWYYLLIPHDVRKCYEINYDFFTKQCGLCYTYTEEILMSTKSVHWFGISGI